MSLWEEKIAISNAMPLYQQLEHIIVGRIKTGKLKRGELLPSEHELCAGFQLSRSTVRQALKNLEEQGFIIRRRGIGTMVAEPQVHRKLGNLYSFTKQMQEMGYETQSTILTFEKVNVSKEVAEKMQIGKNTPAFEITRLRIANNQPMLLENTIIIRRFCPDLKPEWLETGSLYSILTDQYHVDMDHAVETYEPILAEKKVTDLLECGENSCAFQIERKTFTRQGDIFELTRSVMPGKRSKLEITLYQDKIRLSRM